MSTWILGYGGLLTALGAGGFIATGKQHKTALIPAAFGAAALGLGALARRPRQTRRALQGTAGIAALAIAGSWRGLRRLPDLLAGRPVERRPAVIAQSLMAGLSGAARGTTIAALARRPSR
jgi:hypothetical protein